MEADITGVRRVLPFLLFLSLLSLPVRAELCVEVGAAPAVNWVQSLDSDGDWVIQGAAGDGMEPGGVRLIRISDGVQFPLEGDPEELDHFGVSVAIEGDLVAVGAPGTDEGAGAVHVYRLIGEEWEHERVLTAPWPTYLMGMAVSVSDGRIAVGEPQAVVDGHLRAGAVHVFTQVGEDTWAARRLFEHPPGPDQQFGVLLDLKHDLLVVGSRNHPGDFGGRLFIYRRRGPDWQLVSASGWDDGPQEGGFGRLFPMAVVTDGEVVAASLTTGSGFGRTPMNHVRMFDGSSGSWERRHVLRRDGDVSYGQALALRDGALAVGEPDVFDNPTGIPRGAVTLHREVDDEWREVTRVEATDTRVSFGVSVALGPDARAMHVGFSQDILTTPTSWVASLECGDDPAGPCFIEDELAPPDPVLPDARATSASLIGGRLLLGFPDIAQAASYEWTGLEWELAARLFPDVPEHAHRFGESVLILGDDLLVGAPHGPGGGSVHVFSSDGTHLQRLDAIAPGDEFGATLVGEGNELFIGAPAAPGAGGSTGRVQLWTRGADWNQVDAWTTDAADGARFGSAIALHGDLLAVGEPGAGEGRVQLFRRLAGEFQFERALTQPDATTAAPDEFGRAVALWEGGLFVGAAWSTNALGLRRGGVYSLEDRGATWEVVENLADAWPEDWSPGESLRLRGERMLIASSEVWRSELHVLGYHLAWGAWTHHALHPGAGDPGAIAVDGARVALGLAEGDEHAASVASCCLDLTEPDTDGDGARDPCDPCPLDAADDEDGDGLCAGVDPCPSDPLNDVDGDGWCAGLDNCPESANADQADADGDLVGDACDCAPADPDSARLAAVSDLRVTGAGLVSWTPNPVPGIEVEHHVVVGSLTLLPWTRSLYNADCIGPLPQPSHDDGARAGSFYYLGAGLASCGFSDLGRDGEGYPREVTACP